MSVAQLGASVRLALSVGGALALAHCSLTNFDELQGGDGQGGSGGAHDAGGQGDVVASGGFPNGGSTDSGADATDSGGCEKLCNGACVTKGPDNGCDAVDCAPCSLDHAVAGCAAGKCSIVSCVSGRGDCDHVADNGCETTLGTSEHCSSCTDVCSAPIGTTACESGACKVTACPTDRSDCDGLVGNGCEADLTTSATCADCNTQCVTGLPCTKTPGGSYICACENDAACLNGGTCYLGFCICGGNACAFNQRCALDGSCFSGN